jgi:uncharacterized cupredoxin-like copper-binding protein
MRRLLLLGGIAAVLVFGWADQTPASHTGLVFGAPARVNVTMTEYKFSPQTITVEAGTPVDLVLENKGLISHVFMVYPQPKSLPKGTGAWWDYILANTYLRDMGEILVHVRGEFVVAGTRLSEVAVEPGKKVTLTFTPARKGTFEIGCHLATGGGGSHYTAGMKGTLVVK